MKHLVLILLMSLATYFGWYYMDKKLKRGVKKFGLRHIFAVLAIVTFAFGGLVVLFYNRAINIL